MRNVKYICIIASAIILLSSLTLSAVPAKSSVTAEEARAIARQAYIYGFPLADSYRILYGAFVDKKNPCLLYTSDAADEYQRV